MKKTLLIFTLVFVLSGQLLTQSVQPKSALTINVDYSRYAMSSDTAYVEVSYALYPLGVTLERKQDTLKGSVILHSMIKNSRNDSLILRSSVAVPILINDSASLDLGIVWKTIFILPVGSYELNVLGYDQQNISNRDSVQKKFTIERKSPGVGLSDIDLCTRIVQSDNKTSLFYKNSYEVIPNPSLLFGKSITPVIFSYNELYNLNPDSTYLIIAGIVDAKGRLIKGQRQIRRYSNPNIVDVHALNIALIPSGRYRFVFIIADTLGKEVTHAEKQVFIYNPHITAEVDLITARSADFSGMTDDELIDEFQKAKYIANSESIKLFEKGISTVNGRREFMANFWTNIEKNQDGLNRRMYLDRVSTADQRYPGMGRKGWRTDRGRVYVLNGEPDDIQRFPSSENAKPYEIWIYHQIENGVQFVFIDRTGFGDYILVHSTKRGELQDETWERYLQ
jgi:GWxTD domain-containing protein